jgi:hypothetical protein
MDQAKETVANVSDKVTNTASNLMSQVSTAGQMLQTSNGLLIVGAIISIFVLMVIVLAFYWMINRTINNRKKYVIPETKVPIVASKLQSFDASLVPAPGNGKRVSFTFWIYIHDMNKYQGLYKNVLYRGDVSSSTATSSPVVLLDSTTNKMHIMFGTEKPDPYEGKKNNIGIGVNGVSGELSKEREVKYLVATRGITIDYIPIQRWVHIGIVVNEEINGGAITAYVVSRTEADNSVVLQAEGTTLGAVETKLDIQNMNLDKRGNIYIGGSTESIVQGFSGLLSRLTFYNYDLNVRDMYNSYMEGPVDGLATKIGAAYGVRTPIYRLG